MNVSEYIKNAPLLFDGAFGTYYSSVAEDTGAFCEYANINDPQTVINIHREYINAGAKAIKTNTFCANTKTLGCSQDILKKIVDAACKNALSASSGKDVFVFADMGIVPSCETDVLSEYILIADIFLQNGITDFLFETLSSDDYLIEISEYIKSKCNDAFIIVSFAVSAEGLTRSGLHGETLFNTVSHCKNIDAVGFNCISGIHHLSRYIRKFDIKDKIVSVMPNAGYPTVLNGRTVFQDNSRYFASEILSILKCGVKITGGCCGTTPNMIRAVSEKIQGFAYSDVVYGKLQSSEQSGSSTEISSPALIRKMNEGKKIIAVELDPPVDTDISFFMESAERLRNLGTDAITLADCPLARARVDSSLLACKLKRELGITPIPHMTCRDRNINATKALLLGLSIEGIENVLTVTGDPVPPAQRDEVKSMFSFNSCILARHIKVLNETSFKKPFTIFGAINVNALNFEYQLKHARKKIENGVSAFLTQPVLTKQALDNLKLAHNTLNAKILGGIIPIVSHRNALFMNNEISGINVSEEIIKMYEGVSKEEASELAVNISVKIAEEISQYCDGFYIITPFKRIDIVSDIIRRIQKSDLNK